MSLIIVGVWGDLLFYISWALYPRITQRVNQSNLPPLIIKRSKFLDVFVLWTLAPSLFVTFKLKIRVYAYLGMKGYPLLT